MENNWFNRIIKNLYIGDFVIACSRNGNGPKAEIPYSGMAFYLPKDEICDFKFQINKVEDDNSGILIFGSESFATPTLLFRREHGYYDWITKKKDGTPRISFRISSDWSEFVLYEDNTKTLGERAFYEFGSLFAYAVLNHSSCVLHGVVMEYEGKGILVTAPSGTGKTTHTRMWRDYKNALIINGDRCLCRKIDGIWYAYGMPWAGSSGEYINRKVPISCIVNLKRGNENYVKPMSIFDGSVYLMERIFAPIWKCKMQDAGLDICEELATSFPILELHCRPDLESVDVLEEAIKKYGR